MFVENGCYRAKVFVFEQNVCNRVKLLYSDKSGSIPAKVVVFRQKSGCIRARRFCSGKVVIFGKK